MVLVLAVVLSVPLHAEGLLDSIKSHFTGGASSDQEKTRRKLAEEKCGFEGHPHFKRATDVFDKLSEKIRKKPSLNAGLRLATGYSGEDYLWHYRELMFDAVGGTGSETNGFGGGSSGYFGGRDLFSDEDLARLGSSLDGFGKKFNEKTNWKEFRSLFQNDARLALKAILYSSGWVRRAIFRPEALNGKLANFSEYGIPAHLDANDSGVLKNNSLGLNLSGPDANGRGVGKGYKTINGMLHAIRLWEMGYSDEDILFVLSRMHLMYEASDSLFDHCGIQNNTSVYQVKNVDARFGDSPTMLSALEKVKAKLNSDPKLKSRMMGYLVKIPGLMSCVPGVENMLATDGEEKLNPMLLLMTQFLEDPEAYHRDWDSVLSSVPEEKALMERELNLGKNDINIVLNGARFALEKLKHETPTHPKKMRGMIANAKHIDPIFAKLSGKP